MKEPFHYKKLLPYFLQGLLILAPVAITAYSIYFVVSGIDSWIPIFYHRKDYPLPFDANYQKKAAYYGLLKGLTD